MKTLNSSLFSVILFFCSCSSKTVSTQPEVVVVERPAPPYAGAVWIDNEYEWRGASYVVVPAHYVRNTRAWVPGHWRPVPRGYRWVRGHWQ